MLRVIVESASGIPKKKLGNPDPIAAIVFRGERFQAACYFDLFFSFSFFLAVACSVNFLCCSVRSCLQCFSFKLYTFDSDSCIKRTVHPYKGKTFHCPQRLVLTVAWSLFLLYANKIPECIKCSSGFSRS